MKTLTCRIPGCIITPSQDYDEYCDMHLAELEADYKDYEAERYSLDEDSDVSTV